MKLMSSPLKTNIDFKNSFPSIIGDNRKEISIKSVENYVLNSIRVILIETIMNEKIILMSNENNKIKKSEIDFVMEKFFGQEREHVSLTRELPVYFSKFLIKKQSADYVLIKYS